MMTKSPSGALSPYYYKGGYFHGIHFGSYFDHEAELFDMMEQEETFILKSNEKRRVLIDLYETDMSEKVLERLMQHILLMKQNVIKLAIATDRRSLKKIEKSLRKQTDLNDVCCYFGTDMEECKTWLVSDH